LIVLVEEGSTLGLRLHAISRFSWRDCARIRYHTVAACSVTGNDEPEEGGLKIGCRQSEQLNRGDTNANSVHSLRDESRLRHSSGTYAAVSRFDGRYH
jgi:hypothetical protein